MGFYAAASWRIFMNRHDCSLASPIRGGQSASCVTL
jgi:hypothetical protein